MKHRTECLFMRMKDYVLVESSVWTSQVQLMEDDECDSN